MGKKLSVRPILWAYNFDKKIRSERSAEVKTKLLGLSHLSDGKDYRQVAEIVKVHENTVRDWEKIFAVEGYEGLKRKSGQGRKPLLPQERAEELKQAVIELQNQREGGRIRGKDVQELLSEKFSVTYKLSAVYDLLHAIGLVWISARSKHPASNQATQEAFKKTLQMKSKSDCLMTKI